MGRSVCCYGQRMKVSSAQQYGRLAPTNFANQISKGRRSTRSATISQVWDIL